MKVLGLLLLSALSATIIHAQPGMKPPRSKAEIPEIILATTPEKPFPETMEYGNYRDNRQSIIFKCGDGSTPASFPGNLMDFIAANMKYPDSARANQIEGRVVVTFTIRKDGCIDAPKVVRSTSKYLDEEALRLISIMPEWKPGTMNGVPVDSWFTMPITFRLD
jgi:TonB family protein